VNLSPNSPPINISLFPNDSTKEFSGLAYKSVSQFNSYPAGSAVNSYTFYVFDAANDSLLATYALSAPFPYFQNVTLALVGLDSAGSSTPLSIARINH
jgi:hypothetical protein